MSDHKSRTKAEDRSRASSVLNSAGYASGGAAKMIKKAFDEHDSQLHGGKKTHLKFARGGGVDGGKGKRGAKVQINIHTGPKINAGGRPGPAGIAPPNPAAAGGPPGGVMPPRPMMPQAPMGVGGPSNPMVRPGGMATGGAIKYGDGVMEGGAASGVGRIDKLKEYGQGERVAVKGHSRRHPSRFDD